MLLSESQASLTKAGQMRKRNGVKYIAGGSSRVSIRLQRLLNQQLNEQSALFGQMSNGRGLANEKAVFQKVRTMQQARIPFREALQGWGGRRRKYPHIRM